MRPAATGLTRDSVSQTGVRYRTGVLFGSLLVVIGDVHFDIGGEQQSCIRFGFDGPSAACPPFVRGARTDGQHFRPLEDIPVAIVNTCCDTPVSGAVRAFQFGRDRVESSFGNRDGAVQQRVADRRERHVYIAHRR